MNVVTILNFIVAALVIMAGPVGAYYYFESLERAHRKKLENVSYAVQFEPPEGLTPTEVGIIVDGQAHVRDVLATMFDLANRGYLRIKEIKLGNGHKDFDLTLLKSDFRQDVNLKPHESYIMGVFFGAGKHTLMGDIVGSGALISARDAIEKRAFGQMTVLGYYDGRPAGKMPDHTHQVMMALLLPAMMTTFILVFGDNSFAVVLYSICVSIFFGVWMSMIYGHINHAITESGLEVRRQALGFREYLMCAEKYRIEWQISEQVFSRYMPYALAFDVLEPFVRAEAWRSDDIPQWFETGQFVTDISDMATFVKDVVELSSVFGASIQEVGIMIKNAYDN